MSKLDWNKLADQRAGAKKFLERTASDPQFRRDVLANPSYAREGLLKEGDFASIPPEVEVQCLPPSTLERAGFVLFLLPQENATSIEPLAHWIAAWPPYDE